jgi:DNA-binding transcriptional regulator YiaG
MAKRTQIGLEVEAALKEALAHRRGEIALPMREVAQISKERVREIRKAVSTNLDDFERRFCLPRRTVEAWEQGRNLNHAALVLMTVIDREPEAVERALTKMRALT